MENKLAHYQLAAPQLGGCTSCRSAMSVPIKQWNYSFDNIMNRFTQLVGAAGSVNNLINAFRSGQDVPGMAGLSEEDRKFYLQMAQANIKNGGGNAGNEAMMQFLTQMQQQNAAMLPRRPQLLQLPPLPHQSPQKRKKRKTKRVLVSQPYSSVAAYF